MKLAPRAATTHCLAAALATVKLLRDTLMRNAAEEPLVNRSRSTSHALHDSTRTAKSQSSVARAPHTTTREKP